MESTMYIITYSTHLKYCLFSFFSKQKCTNKTKIRFVHFYIKEKCQKHCTTKLQKTQYHQIVHFLGTKKDFCSSYYVGMYEESEDCKIVLLHYLIIFMKIIETNNKYIGKLLNQRLKQVEN